MKKIWSEPKAEYHGEFINFDPSMAWPKPAQKPHPPIHVGGALPKALDEQSAMAMAGFRQPGATSLPRFLSFKRWRDGGRDPASLEITSFGLAEDLDRLKRLRDLGVARVVPMFPPEKSDKVLPIIDRWTKLMQQVNG